VLPQNSQINGNHSPEIPELLRQFGITGNRKSLFLPNSESRHEWQRDTGGTFVLVAEAQCLL
jgi:hypothetical protein